MIDLYDKDDRLILRAGWRKSDEPCFKTVVNLAEHERIVGFASQTEDSFRHNDF